MQELAFLSCLTEELTVSISDLQTLVFLFNKCNQIIISKICPFPFVSLYNEFIERITLQCAQYFVPSFVAQK